MSVSVRANKKDSFARILTHTAATVLKQTPTTDDFSGNKNMGKAYPPYAGYDGASAPGRTGDGVQML